MHQNVATKTAKSTSPYKQTFLSLWFAKYDILLSLKVLNITNKIQLPM